MIVRTLLENPNSSTNTYINTYYVRDKAYHIRDADVTAKLKETVTAIGPSILGFTENKVGTHSIRTSTAMAMVLAQKDIYLIKLIGRWESDAFMRYIRPQIQEFTIGLSSDMTQLSNFYTLPSFKYHESREITKSSTPLQNWPHK